MSDLRAAAQQALEALEHDGLLKKRQAITALRAALPCTYKCEAWPECACAALAQEQEPKLAPAPGRCKHCRQYTVEEPLPAQEEREQEPVAWMLQHRDTGRKNYVSNDGCNGPGRFLVMNPRYALVCALYTHPPRREWRSLTKEEIQTIVNKVAIGTYQTSDTFARAIEAALKERNNG